MPFSVVEFAIDRLGAALAAAVVMTLAAIVQECREVFNK